MKQRMDDMIPPEKRSIRRVRLDRKDMDESSSSTHKETADRTTTHNENEDEHQRLSSAHEDRLPPRPPHMRRRRTSSGGGAWWKWGLGALLVVILAIFTFSVAFGGATISVEPQSESITINGEFGARIASTVTDLSVLPFETATLSLTEETTLDATGEREVEENASGQIIIYNDFDESGQLLIENTRFETPEGLIYRIRDAVTVPGQRTNEAGETVPGSLEVTVYADQPGEEYNIGLTDFTIPGLEGDPRYFDFYARSETPMTGGFSGLQKVVDASEEESARDTMQADLATSLTQQINAEIPEGYVTFDGLSTVSYRSLATESAAESDQAVIREEGTITALIFDEVALSSFIAAQTIAAYDGAPVRLDSFDELSISTEDVLSEAGVGSDTLTLSLSGGGTLIWQFDEAALRADLAGENEDNINTILANYPAIERARITIRPFWRSQFPEDPEDITIENQLTR